MHLLLSTILFLLSLVSQNLLASAEPIPPRDVQLINPFQHCCSWACRTCSVYLCPNGDSDCFFDWKYCCATQVVRAKNGSMIWYNSNFEEVEFVGGVAPTLAEISGNGEETRDVHDLAVEAERVEAETTIVDVGETQSRTDGKVDIVGGATAEVESSGEGVIKARTRRV